MVIALRSLAAVGRNDLFHQRQQALRLWISLRRKSPAAVLQVLRLSRQPPTWALYARFLRESRRSLTCSHLAPFDARRLAAVARALSLNLPNERLSTTELEIAACVAAAEADVFLGRPLRAEQDLKKLIPDRASIADRALRAEVARVLGVIEYELGRFPQAALRFEEAFLDLGLFAPRRRRAYLLACRARALAAFHPERARQAFDAVLEELELLAFPRLAVAVHLARVDLAHSEGHLDQALATLGAARRQFGQLKEVSETERLALDWRRALVASKRQPARAQALLERISARFASTWNLRDATFAVLDLVALDLSRGARQEAANQLDELASRLAILGLHDEGLSALQSFREEISRPPIWNGPRRFSERSEALDALDKLRIYLGNHWWRPGLWQDKAPSAFAPMGFQISSTRWPLAPLPSYPSPVMTHLPRRRGGSDSLGSGPVELSPVRSF